MKAKKVMAGVLSLLLLASNVSFAKGKVSEAAVAYKTVMQEIKGEAQKNSSARKGAAAGAAMLVVERQMFVSPYVLLGAAFVGAGIIDTEKKFWDSFRDVTKDCPKFAKLLGKSPVFSNYKVGFIDAPYFSQTVFEEVASFISNPYKRVPFETISAGSVYRFYFSEKYGSQVWATVDIGRKLVLVNQASIRDPNKPYINYLIKPKK